MLFYKEFLLIFPVGQKDFYFISKSPFCASSLDGFSFFFGLFFFSFSTFFTFLFGFEGFDGSVVEKINDNIPVLIFFEFTSKDSNFSSQKPVDHRNRFSGSVVAGNGNINPFQWGVRVAKSDAGDIGVGGFDDGLFISSGVGNDQESGFLELLGHLIGQGSWGPSGGGGRSGVGVGGELNNGSLSEGSGRNDNNFSWVVDGGDNSSS